MPTSTRGEREGGRERERSEKGAIEHGGAAPWCSIEIFLAKYDFPNRSSSKTNALLSDTELASESRARRGHSMTRSIRHRHKRDPSHRAQTRERERERENLVADRWHILEEF